MNPALTIGVLVALAILLIAGAVALVLTPARRSRHLRRKFGAEYDWEVEHARDRRAAERELARREKRYAKLNLRPLSDAARQEYTGKWAAIQERFVDAPADAVREADRLLTRLMSDRGYPTGGPEQTAAALSVERPHAVAGYRAACAVLAPRGSDPPGTEELRVALVHYRDLLTEILASAAPPDDRAGTPQPVGSRDPSARPDPPPAH
ncbi:hypothetical protein [Marinitenerispora sediminis]|uniref:Secreted protein n=1 Tax=Marinitenerispora sediminis TaxID=1931232 RepID=A0A368T692_9ACTN|nr:hypothetical protein [Marinitenerispora sediminis]RCV57434.1 hypothetical protein DEF28_01635 [Marinitenerispora sediminis]RCV58983.1 hypothetical protein DEF24_11505 [Marinitenerispora sediminis]RCV61275.1 hypothetical protein DEF23_02640 [Marinitenerispora sediminis]